MCIFLGHCNTTHTYCLSEGKALSAFLSSPVVACTLAAPQSYQPYATLNYPICLYVPFPVPFSTPPFTTLSYIALPYPTLQKGSLLGTILFLLFVNDMPRVLKNALLAMFADDSKCYKIINQESDFVNLQHDLDVLSTWSVRPK